MSLDMRPIAYLACLILVAPVVAFTIMHDAIMAVAASDTLGELLGALWRGLSKRRPIIDATPLWGLYVLTLLLVAGVIAFVALGWSERHAWMGFGVVALVGLGLTVLVFVRDGAPPSVRVALLHLPALIGVALAVWVMSVDPRVAALRTGWSRGL
jgi:hypothetical protein